MKGYPKVKKVIRGEVQTPLCFHLVLKVRPHPYLLLENLSFPRHQGICFADDWDNIDLLVHCPEESHI